MESAYKSFQCLTKLDLRCDPRCLASVIFEIASEEIQVKISDESPALASSVPGNVNFDILMPYQAHKLFRSYLFEADTKQTAEYT